MNLISRTLTRVVSSSLYHSRITKLPTQKWVISQQIRVFSATVIGTGGRKPWAKASVKPPLNVAAEKESTPPKMIEYKPEISNWINLIGFVEQPVQFGPCSDGKFWAGTVISQRSGSKSSNFWIPIIFEGDLAQIAVQHVKKEDRIHVSGKLFIDSPPPNVTYSQSNVQVMVQNLNFVQAATSLTKTISPPEKEVISTKKRPARSKKVKVIDEETSNSWKHLIENPKEWLDHRGNKANGLVKPGHPDFKMKVGGLSLWLSAAPDWALLKLEELELDVFVPKGNIKLNQLKGEESWKDLVQNPDKWLDNRLDKTNVKYPDFKHKETGEALWMTNSPIWVLSKLPPLKKNQERPLMSNTVPQLELDVVVPNGNLTQLKREESWKNLVENPSKWWDNRLDKRNPKAPDFKHKETGEVLWINNNSPTWALSKLPPLKKNQERPVMA
ncbi:Primosome PriB/single-strand DNA-binding [Arabidopsis thaliana x Arabidopsis arenosa]|uniref:Primosome PriB/single-strand DNA-binding n=1 Tax=Arabidopsis thaliana x Arabidopsis arenosa TaxID=1240361 RepID=A0A8T1XDX4_9BRAS|nr:Primosome PriB/single-strand DNA-binding [Arabidopsis thaliana x Arabidopsis arenosa]